MNRILLATICGVVLGALIFAMAQSDRFVGAQSLTQSPQQTPAFNNTLAMLPEQQLTSSEPVNALAPRSGRSQVGTSRGRNRSAFALTPSQTSQALTDLQTQNSENTRITREISQARDEQRRQRALRAAELTANMRNNVERQRALYEQQRAQIRARTSGLLRDPSQLLTSTAAVPTTSQLLDGAPTDVSQALQLLSDALNSDGQQPAGLRVTSETIEALIGAYADGGPDGPPSISGLAALLQQLGFGDFDIGARGPTSLEIATFGRNGLPQLIFPESTIETLWLPVERDINSRDLSTTRTNDLFIVYSLPTMVTVLESPPNVGVQVHNGSFVQVDGGGNGPTSLSPSDARSFDSFLTLNGNNPLFIGDSPLNPDDWGSVIDTTWFTAPPSPGTLNPDRFGDFRSYVWVGRFTVKANQGKQPVVSGRIKASSLNLITGKLSDDFLVIDADPSLWVPINELAPLAPRLRSFQLDSSTLESGTDLILSVDLDITAPRTGIEVQLHSDNPLITLPNPETIPPNTVTIPYNAIGIDITVPTTFSFDPADVLLTVSTNGEQISQLVSLQGHTRGDTSGDGFVDGTDLGFLLGSWGANNDPRTDINGDGIVDGADLGQLLGAWRTPDAVPQAIGLNARWIPVPISDTCAADLEGIRTSDLYIGFDQDLDNKFLIITSAIDTGLRVEGGTFFQDSLFVSNAPPSDGILSLAPCIAYDSYLTLGDAPPFFTPTNNPGTDWTTTLVAEWLSGIFDQDAIFVENNPTKFGDNRYYIRIARISASLGSTFLGGTLTVIDGGTITDVTVEHCPTCWGDFDFNNDGFVDSADVSELTTAIQVNSTNIEFDINGDGIVNTDDLLLLLMVFPNI